MIMITMMMKKPTIWLTCHDMVTTEKEYTKRLIITPSDLLFGFWVLQKKQLKIDWINEWLIMNVLIILKFWPLTFIEFYYKFFKFSLMFFFHNSNR